jgi:SAM-dependent methyltransferase
MTASFSQWLDSSLGRYLLAHEQGYLDQVTPDIFGFFALQLSLPGIDLLRESRIPHRFRVGPAADADALTLLQQLPIASQCVDLVVAPHVLEFTDHPHEVLREIDRIMMPEGRLILIGFNPWSLWGLKRHLSGPAEAPWNGRYVSLPRIRDWLRLLGFDVTAGRLACYAPPLADQRWRERFRFMEAAGDRWWGVGGGIYMLQAVKRVIGMRLIAPQWRDQRRAPRELAAAKQAARLQTRLKVVK